MVKYLAKNCISQHALAPLKARMCLLAQQVASIRQDLIQAKTESSCIFQAGHPLNTAPCCYSTRVRLKDSCPTGLVLDTCRIFFIFFFQSASTSHACIHYSRRMKQWAQINLKHKRGLLSWLATKEIGKQRQKSLCGQKRLAFSFLFFLNVN